MIRRGPRGGGRRTLHMNLYELMVLGLGQAMETRNSIAQTIPEWLTTPLLETSSWDLSPYSPEISQRRGCCFGAASIALDVYRETIFPDLPKELVGSHWSGSSDPRCYQVLPGDTLGDALSRFVDYLSTSDGAQLRRELRNANWFLRLHSTMNAQVSYWENGLTFISQFGHGQNMRMPGRTHSVTLSFAVFEKLADLWADSKAHGEKLSFPFASGSSSSGNANPGNENATLPGVAPSIPGLPTKPVRGHAADRSLNTCDHTSRACVSSTGFGSAANSPTSRRRSNARAPDHHSSP